MKKIAIVISVIGIALLFILFLNEKDENQNGNSNYAQMEKELIPLNVEKRELEQELRILENEATEKVSLVGSTVLVFTQLDEKIYTNAYERMKGREFPGVIVLSSSQYPGAEGCLSKEWFDELIEAGWEYCVLWEGQEKTGAFLEELGLEPTENIYFPKGTYEEEYEEILKTMGYVNVVHCCDGDLELLEPPVKTEMFYAGSYGMNAEAPRNYLQSAMEEGSNIVYLVGFEEGLEMYDDDTFQSMISWFSSYKSEGELVITTLTGARTHRDNLANQINGENQKIAPEVENILNRLDEIEKEIDEIYKRYI